MVLVALLAGGCTEPGTPAAATQAIPTDATPTGTPAPTTAAVVSPDPTAEPTVEPTAAPAEPTAEPTLEPDGTPRPCPTGKVLTVDEFVDARFACFGEEDVRIRGWLDFPPPMGFEGPGIEPDWLVYPVPDVAALWSAVPRGELHRCPTDAPDCTWFFPHVSPTSGLSFLPLERWVVVTGHVRDPRAATCHYVETEGWEGIELDDRVAVRICRHSFVVTAIEDVS